MPARIIIDHVGSTDMVDRRTTTGPGRGQMGCGYSCLRWLLPYVCALCSPIVSGLPALRRHEEGTELFGGLPHSAHLCASCRRLHLLHGAVRHVAHVVGRMDGRAGEQSMNDPFTHLAELSCALPGTSGSCIR